MSAREVCTMSALGTAILVTWRRNGAYALRLVGDLTDEQMIAQPAGLGPGIVMNHPAWILAHLSLYASVAAAIAAGQPFPDPLDHPHGMRSKPLADAGAYLARGQLIEAYRAEHEGAERAVAAADDAAFARPNPLARQREAHPTVGDMLLMLMAKHESLHLGQLSAWRRAMGLPSVAM